MASKLFLPGNEDNYTSSPDSPAFDIINLDVRIALAMADWTPTKHAVLVSKYEDGVGGFGLRIQSGSGGFPAIFWHTGSSSGSMISTAKPTIADGGFLILRGTLRVDNGSGQREAKFYYKNVSRSVAVEEAESDDDWVQLGSTVVVGSTTVIADTTADILIGRSEFGDTILFQSPEADILCVVLKNGIDGSIVYEPDFTIQPFAVTEFEESSSYGATVTIHQSGSPYAEIVKDTDVSGPVTEAVIPSPLDYGEFFPDTHLQAIIQATDGKLVTYRGQEAYFHVEDPTYDDIMGNFGSVQGLAKILIGDATVFPDLEENTLIKIEGESWVVAEWKTPLDGGVAYIALKRNLRP